MNNLGQEFSQQLFVGTAAFAFPWKLERLHLTRGIETFRFLFAEGYMWGRHALKPQGPENVGFYRYRYLAGSKR